MQNATTQVLPCRQAQSASHPHPPNCAAPNHQDKVASIRSQTHDPKGWPPARPTVSAAHARSAERCRFRDLLV